MNTNSNENINLIVFSLGTENFGIDTDYVINIIDHANITPIPRSPKTLKGVINLRGSILPLVSTHTLLDIPALSNDKYNYIVIEISSYNHNIKFAIEVDSVMDVIEIDKHQILPPPKLGINFPDIYLKGIVKKDRQFILILNIEQVFITDNLYKSKYLKTM